MSNFLEVMNEIFELNLIELRSPAQLFEFWESFEVSC